MGPTDNASRHPTRKPVVWLHGEVKTPPFSVDGRRETGFLLWRLQVGEMLSMPHSRPMPSIGPRCHELRVRDEDTNWRIFYRIDPDAIVVAGVEEKKTRQTPKSMLDTIRERLRQHDRDS